MNKFIMMKVMWRSNEHHSFISASSSGFVAGDWLVSLMSVGVRVKISFWVVDVLYLPHANDCIGRQDH